MEFGEQPQRGVRVTGTIVRSAKYINMYNVVVKANDKVYCWVGFMMNLTYN